MTIIQLILLLLAFYLALIIFSIGLVNAAGWVVWELPRKWKRR